MISLPNELYNSKIRLMGKGLISMHPEKHFKTRERLDFLGFTQKALEAGAGKSLRERRTRNQNDYRPTPVLVKKSGDSEQK